MYFISILLAFHGQVFLNVIVTFNLDAGKRRGATSGISDTDLKVCDFLSFWMTDIVYKCTYHACFPLPDLKTRKSTGTSFQIELHFSMQTTKFLMKYNLVCFQISGGLATFFCKHDC